jgi:hypothetical protein
MASATPKDVPILPRVVFDVEDIITSSLAFVQNHLDMEVAYLSEFVGENLVFRAINAPGFEDLFAIGDQILLDQVFCPHIVQGRLPQLIPDTKDVPFIQNIGITPPVPIRSHVSVPIRRTNGAFMECIVASAANHACP